MALYPLAFYTSMHLAGVAVGTVVSIGSAPLASALIERLADGRSLSRRWLAGAALGLAGTVLLCAAEAARAGTGAGTGSARQTVVGVGLGLVAGLTYAVYAWAAHRLITRGVASRAAMGTVFGLGGLMLVPVLLATGAPLVASWTNAGVGLYMALVPMFTGYVLFGFGLSASRSPPRRPCPCWNPPWRRSSRSWSWANTSPPSAGPASPSSSPAWAS